MCINYYVQHGGSVSNMPNKQSQYQILKSLEIDSSYTQRQLSSDLDMSLGSVNYCLKGLVEKSLVKISNLRKNENKTQYSYLFVAKRCWRKSKVNHRIYKNKVQYSYLLTPKGIEEKAGLTIEFIRIKTQEYNRLKNEIKGLKSEAGKYKKQYALYDEF